MNERRRPATNRRGFAAGAVAGVLVASAIVFLLFTRDQGPATPPATQTQASEPALTAPAPAESFDPAALAAVERISPDGLQDLMSRGEAVIIDVRDVDSYKAGHIPGALQIPLQYIGGEVQYFPRDKKLVTYCT